MYKQKKKIVKSIVKNSHNLLKNCSVFPGIVYTTHIYIYINTFSNLNNILFKNVRDVEPAEHYGTVKKCLEIAVCAR